MTASEGRWKQELDLVEREGLWFELLVTDFVGCAS